jgi:serine/threonine protein kinase
VHRAIEPANILVTPSGHPKLTDFGIARLSQGAQHPGLTQPGMLIGTSGYMAPEQARGGHTDHRADLFSVGCILYEMLVGRTPFGRDSVAETILRLVGPEPAPMAPVARAAPHYVGVLERARQVRGRALRLRHGLRHGIAAPDDPTLVRTAAAPPGAPLFEPEFSATLSQDLTTYIGPIASTLVRHAAERAQDRDALCRSLAEHLDKPEQRSAFLRPNGGFERIPRGTTVPTVATHVVTTAAGSPSQTSLPADAIAAAQAFSVNARARSRLPSPQIFATAILRLTWRSDNGTRPKNTSGATCPSRKASVVSRGYALTKQASDGGTPCRRSGSSDRCHRSPRLLRRNPPVRAPPGAPTARTSSAPAPGRSAHNPSPPCNRR